MGRLVRPAQFERVFLRSNLESAAPAVVTVGGDSYQDRVAKYIPGEVIAAYMALDRMAVPDVDTFRAQVSAFAHVNELNGKVGYLADPVWRETLYTLIPVSILMLGLVFTPLYIRQLALKSGPGTPWQTQAIISTLAFLVWAYAIEGGVFSVSGLFNGTFASALLIIFTLASGLFEPSPVNSSSAG